MALTLVMMSVRFLSTFKRFSVRIKNTYSKNWLQSMFVHLDLFAPTYEKTQLHPKQLRTNNCLERHYYRIPWNDGNVPYKKIVRMVIYISTMSTVIYVKGLKKQISWDSLIIIINLNDIKAPLVTQSFTPSIKCPVSHQTNIKYITSCTE